MYLRTRGIFFATAPYCGTVGTGTWYWYLVPTVLMPTVPGLDIVTVVSPTGASTHTSYIPFLRQRGEASTGGCLGTSMASNGLNIAEFRGLVY